MRSLHDCIITSSETIMKDNPRLTIRKKYKDQEQIKYSMLRPTNIPLYLIKKLEILGFPKESIMHSEYYNSAGLIKALHLRRTQSKLRLSNMSILKDLLNLFLNT